MTGELSELINMTIVFKVLIHFFPYGLLSDECNNNFITKHLLMP